MASKNHLMGRTVSVSAVPPKHSESAPEKRPRDAQMDALVKHAHSSERFSFATVAAAVKAARGKKTKN